MKEKKLKSYDLVGNPGFSNAKFEKYETPEEKYKKEMLLKQKIRIEKIKKLFKNGL